MCFRGVKHSFSVMGLVLSRLHFFGAVELLKFCPRSSQRSCRSKTNGCQRKPRKLDLNVAIQPFGEKCTVNSVCPDLKTGAGKLIELLLIDPATFQSLPTIQELRGLLAAALASLQRTKIDVVRFACHAKRKDVLSVFDERCRADQNIETILGSIQPCGFAIDQGLSWMLSIKTAPQPVVSKAILRSAFRARIMSIKILPSSSSEPPGQKNSSPSSAINECGLPSTSCQ